MRPALLSPGAFLVQVLLLAAAPQLPANARSYSLQRTLFGLALHCPHRGRSAMPVPPSVSLCMLRVCVSAAA